MNSELIFKPDAAQPDGLPEGCMAGVMVFKPSTTTFDNHRFMLDMGYGVSFLETAYRARRGDAAAVELLTAFRVTIYTVSELGETTGTYWPMTIPVEDASADVALEAFSRGTP